MERQGLERLLEAADDSEAYEAQSNRTGHAAATHALPAAAERQVHALQLSFMLFSTVLVERAIIVNARECAPGRVHWNRFSMCNVHRVPPASGFWPLTWSWK